MASARVLRWFDTKPTYSVVIRTMAVIAPPALGPGTGAAKPRWHGMRKEASCLGSCTRCLTSRFGRLRLPPLFWRRIWLRFLAACKRPGPAAVCTSAALGKFFVPSHPPQSTYPIWFLRYGNFGNVLPLILAQLFAILMRFSLLVYFASAGP